MNHSDQELPLSVAAAVKRRLIYYPDVLLRKCRDFTVAATWLNNFKSARIPALFVNFRLVFGIWYLVFLGGSSAAPAASPTNPPPIRREFRGAWIATMSNIDWPSKPGLNASEQKAELRQLLDSAARLHLNAVFLQVRPASDAFYKSSIEPWSEYLTGLMGKAPEPSYDPLQFAVAEAHARGLELHAWFNPYRAGFAHTRYTSPQHVSRRHPNWIRRYGSLLWLDPAEQAVQDYVTKVILDVVHRYDIDGVHLDDYFYPYPEALQPGVFREFNDDITWKRYVKSGGGLARNEWRRQNVNKLVQRLHREIHLQKPWLLFGISPFGIWRPGFPSQIRGLDAYNSLCADARHWLITGIVDYLAPQLYWPSNQREQSYPVLLDWWSRQSEKNIPIWPGGDITKAGSSWPVEEIIHQIDLTRKSSSQPGYTIWHLKAVANNVDLRNRLTTGPYAEPALLSTSRTGRVATPTLTASRQSSGKPLIRWSAPPTERVAFWALQTKQATGWRTEILPAAAQSKELSPDTTEVALSLYTPFRLLSPPALLRP